MLTFQANLLGAKNYAKNFPCICTYDLSPKYSEGIIMPGLL